MPAKESSAANATSVSTPSACSCAVTAASVSDNAGGIHLLSQISATHPRIIKPGLGLRNSVLLHERCFLAVEGETEQQSIPLLFRLSQGLSLQAAGIALWACENNEGALHLARYLVKHQRTVMLMIDADSRNNKLLKDERLRRAGLDLATQVSYVGEAQGRNELEELSTDEQWTVAANQHWPRPAPQTWSPDDFAAHRDGKRFSEGVFRMIRDQAQERSPSGKPDMLYSLTTTLQGAEDVPQQLREVFAQLQQLAH